MKVIKLFLVNFPISDPLNTPKTQLLFSRVFRGYKFGRLARNGLINFLINFSKKPCNKERKTKIYILNILTLCYYHFTYAFRVNLYSIVAWMPMNSLPETGGISEVERAATGFEPTTT